MAAKDKVNETIVVEKEANREEIAIPKTQIFSMPIRDHLSATYPAGIAMAPYSMYMKKPIGKISAGGTPRSLE